MVAPSLSLRGKPAKFLKKGTETTKSHRFETFSQRVSKLKIDPIHRVRRTGFGEEDGEDDETFSHFRSSLDHWSEMNLSEFFTDFVRRVNPLSENLPQVLYHEEKIMALLVEFIDKRDKLSIEPLLSLLSQFARDLGVRFEKHFATSVTLVASVAATHADVEVIEWSFTCLAWIFKFLSRLLVPDLRQLLGIMTPYLGKERQKPFVARFAAESMSFLIRKAGLVYHKNKAPLNRAISFLFQDLRNSTESRSLQTYKEGLMVMFSEAIKGIKGGLYSNASDILKCLIENATVNDEVQFSLAEEVVCGVLTSIVHATTSETFSELLKVVCAYVEVGNSANNVPHFKLSSHLIFVCVTTRKATRVINWKDVHQSLLTLLQRALKGLDAHRDTLPRILTSAAYALQLSPMDEMMPFMRPIMEVISDERLAPYFLSFCSTFSQFGSERFQIVVLQYFQRFLNSFWKTKEEDLCLSLIQLEEVGCVTSQPSRPGFVACPTEWRSQILEKLNKPGPLVDEAAMLNAYTKLGAAISLSNDATVLPQIVQALHKLVTKSLDESASDARPLDIFSSGQGFQTYVFLADQCDSLDRSLWQSISKAGPRFIRQIPFLEATLNYITRLPDLITESKEDLDSLASGLIDNLTSPSQPLRLLSLKILQELIKATTGDAQNTIGITIEIEESELSLQTSRFLSMQVRKLGLLYPQIVSHSWLSKLVPKFCFGLFSKKLGQLWTDAAETLKNISQHAAGEAVVTELCMLWLQHHADDTNDEPTEEEPGKIWSDFRCDNALKIERILEARFERVQVSKEALIESFNTNHKASDLIPVTARARSLQVLHVIPELAEKRSRQIVPLFLRWASTETDSGTVDSNPSEAVGVEEAAPKWAYKDRLALLGLFEKFINPRSLFKSSQVYDALLSLTAHGDSAVQKSALKGLFTWKSPGVRPYEENLINILDESRFREELSVFVHIDDEDSKIEKGHKPEILPILLRLLYGRMISRAASSSGSGGQTGRRKAILRILAQMSELDFELFVQIAFGVLYDLNLSKAGYIDNKSFNLELASERKQVGFLKMVETMLETLQSRMHAYAVKSMDAVTYCLVRASRLLALDSPDLESKAAVLREVRSVGIRCASMIFSIAPDIDWTPYVGLLFTEVINPRLENFAIENAQGVSVFHRLFHEWVSAPKSIFYLTRFSRDVIPAVIDTLTVPSARDDVKVYILEQIIQPIINHSTGRTIEESGGMSDISPRTIREEILAPYVDRILAHVGKLLQSNPTRPVLVSAVETLSLIAPCVETSAEIASLVRISTYLLRQPQDKISPKTKSGLLYSLKHFIPLASVEEDPSFAEEVFFTVSSLFDYFKDEQNRNVLSAVLHEFAKHDADLKEVSILCADLNAVDTSKLDSIDYDRRLAAFRKINEDLWESLSPKQWRPLLFNMLYHVKDEHELSIRSSASHGIKRFIERAADGEANQSSFAALRDSVLLPALQNGVRQRSEQVRSEFVTALGHLVKLNPTLASVQDLHVLLVAGDEEASFFNNILHIQQHRRMRALRRLATEAASGKIDSSNISSVFFPLVEHFVFHIAEDETAHNLAAEAVATLGGLAEWLEWNQFRAIFRRYRANMTSKPEVEKNMIRLLGRMTDALSAAFIQRYPKSSFEGAMEIDDSMSDQPSKCRLALTLPAPAKIATELTTHFLPFLTEFVHHKDEAQMSLRLPVAVTSIKLLKLLPEEDMAIRLPAVLLDVCYVLRSKAQDSRDNARKTLADIAIILGPSYFGYILKELRTALARGYQLHVLSFTVHSILVSTTDEFEQGSLDHCLEQAVAIVMDDIFGVVGQEKDAEDYVSQMKEVKSSKSYDSMELLAKNSSVTRLGALIAPLQMLLREKLTAVLVRKIDELFRRIGLGLLRNPGAESRDILVFCYEVIKESYKDANDAQAPSSTESARNRRFLINMQGMKRGEKRGTTSSYLYKLSRFSLDVLRSVLNKYNFLLTANNVAGFLPIIGDAVIQSYEEVKISAMRLLSTIIKLPLPELDRNASTYLAEAVKVIKEAPSTNTEAAQAALKFIASVLRERKTVELRDNHLSYLLKRLTNDIEEPDRQGLTFNFIRAVMDRKFLVPELYELVDNIARMMVTNQTKAARDLARGVYVHFLLEYPQAKSRWSKQLAFLAKNFDYQHREGRESVMEAVHRLLNKTGGDLGQEIISTFFLPVVLVMANDETVECRQIAGLLLSEFFGRADRERLQIMLKPLHSWIEQAENKQLANTGLQAMRIFFETEDTEKEKEGRFVVETLPELINLIIEDPESEDWETVYFSWQLFLKVCKAVPSVAFSEKCQGLWSNVQESLFYPHAWVKTCAANLIGLWLADLAKTNATEGYAHVPLAGKYGLQLDKDGMIKITRGSIRSVLIPGVTEELAMQSVRNIVFLSRCFAVNAVEFSSKEAEEAKEDGADDDESVAEGERFDNTEVASPKSLLHYIFQQISSILRRETVSSKANALVPKSAIMALLAAVCRHLDADKLICFLPIILLPLQHLIDPNIPAPRSSDPDFQTSWKSLVTNAQEILDLLQKKLGTTEYVDQMARIQENIRARREERRVKRRIDAVADPERFGREKRRKNDRKHVKRKERGHEFRERRRGF
ncbi:HEAT repeat protein (DRIM), putative [Talaromyces stipitatus ATCC 10500]|uniref:HEAT repeat protein (DRIM), putative n=1 Tax=Talaromyces stipitatus (strain ATCC 10500 / CBS 375.48 / QM 6759 / NRRL 1006) TaxID=441959 RepID=B8LZI9_TALSN|nr:HEAT repeat protein (DRIM), putative [Talaromyces stipitatus ATCC 10500]EED22071.1 HEAT repeat protein (DRIM), putative [Talaromyces stipitatus ATCC 10500]